MFLMIPALWQSNHGMLENPQQVALEGPDSWPLIPGIFMGYFSPAIIKKSSFQMVISHDGYSKYHHFYSWDIHGNILDPLSTTFLTQEPWNSPNGSRK